MEISHTISHGIVTIKLIGDIGTAEIPQIKAYVDPLFDSAKANRSIGGAILDLSSVASVQSIGFGFLCAQHIAFKKLQKRFIIANPNAKVYNSIRTLNLHDTFDIYPDKISALHSLIKPF